MSMADDISRYKFENMPLIELLELILFCDFRLRLNTQKPLKTAGIEARMRLLEKHVDQLKKASGK